MSHLDKVSAKRDVANSSALALHQIGHVRRPKTIAFSCLKEVVRIPPLRKMSALDLASLASDFW